MADMVRLWYYIDGRRVVSSASCSPNETINDLKDKIYTMNKNFFSGSGYDALDLILTKVDVDLRGTAEDVSALKYRFETNDPPLLVMDTISDVWPQMPAKDRLHIYVTVDATGDPLPATPMKA